MGVRSKTLVTVLLVGTIVGVLTYTSSNKNLFKGQIFTDEEATEELEELKMPDISADLDFISPAEEDGDIIANVTIKNTGEGIVSGEKGFKYSLFINDAEVFTNTDSFTEMSPGDSFNFQYPVSRRIYNYENSGKISINLDIDNKIEESDETNNNPEITYSF